MTPEEIEEANLRAARRHTMWVARNLLIAAGITLVAVLIFNLASGFMGQYVNR